ncbi:MULTISPECIES: hypothetical protein [unclassified Rhodanobacter]|uniref:Uncharacterized protein n=1 Tax=Rhodanobacter humi TaxID=1888173 RepID=A0ABV4AS00_9GAMM
MTATIERQLDKQRKRYEEAAQAMVGAVTEGGLRAAVHVIVTEASACSEMAVRAEVKAQGVLRRLLDSSGRLVTSIARSAIADPFAGPGTFDAAVFTVGKLLTDAWRLRAGGDA